MASYFDCRMQYKGRGTGAALHMKYLPTSGNAFDVNSRVCREVSLLALFIVNTKLVPYIILKRKIIKLLNQIVYKKC